MAAIGKHPPVARRLAVGLFWWTAVTTPALALECPVPQPQTHPGVLRETPEQIAGLSTYLSIGDVQAKLPAVVSDLRARYPNAVPAEIMNYLITAYCPGIAKGPGSESAKKTALDSFVQQVESLVY